MLEVELDGQGSWLGPDAVWEHDDGTLKPYPQGEKPQAAFVRKPRTAEQRESDKQRINIAFERRQRDKLAAKTMSESEGSDSEGDEGEGRWVTINGNAVKISDDGTVMSGPDALVGTKLGGDKGDDRPAEDKPAEDKPAAEKELSPGRRERLETIEKRIAEIEFIDDTELLGGAYVDPSDDDSIALSLTDEETDELSDAILEYEREAADDYVNELDISFSLDDVAVDNGHSGDDITSKWQEIVEADEDLSDDDHEKLMEVAASADGVDGYDTLIANIPEGFDGLADKMESMKAEAEIEIQDAYDQRVADAENEARDHLIDSGQIDTSDFRHDWLRAHYDNNPERYKAAEAPLNKWVMDSTYGSNGVYKFANPEGDIYEATTGSFRAAGVDGTTFAFFDPKGSIEVTGAGHAKAIFGAVVPAAVSYARKFEPNMLHFSAEGESRIKLYNRLVERTAGMLSNYKPAYAERTYTAFDGEKHIHRDYFLFPSDKFDEYVATANAKGGNLNPMTESMENSDDVPDGMLRPFKADFHPEWDDDESWQELYGEIEPKAEADCPCEDGDKPCDDCDK